MSKREDETMTTSHRRPAALSFIGLALGIAASLAGNLQAINLDSARPGVGAYISAMLWPLALFVAIEIMLHTPWVASRRDSLVKWVGLLGVAFIALYVSYWHLVHVLAAYGYDRVASHVAPLAVDGLLAMATMSLNRVGQARRTAANVQEASTLTPAIVADEAPVQVDTTGQDTIDLTNATDRATEQAAAELAMETESYLERIARELPPPTTPVVPGPVIATQLPSRVRRPGIEPELTELLTAWDAAGRPMTPGQVDEILSAYFGPSTRTIRRRREALGLI